MPLNKESKSDQRQVRDVETIGRIEMFKTSAFFWWARIQGRPENLWKLAVTQSLVDDID